MNSQKIGDLFFLFCSVMVFLNAILFFTTMNKAILNAQDTVLLQNRIKENVQNTYLEYVETEYIVKGPDVYSEILGSDAGVNIYLNGTCLNTTYISGINYLSYVRETDCSTLARNISMNGMYTKKYQLQEITDDYGNPSGAKIIGIYYELR